MAPEYKTLKRIPLFSNLSISFVLAKADPGVRTPPLFNFKFEINLCNYRKVSFFCFYLTGIESFSFNKVKAQFITIIAHEMYPGSTHFFK
jgi:hypothetical protein